MMTLTTVPVNQACKPRMQRAVPEDSHDKNSETINTGLIAISRNSSDSGLDVTDVIIYCIAVIKWLRKTCNRRLAAIQTGGATPTAPQAAQPLPAVAQAPPVAMPVNLPALPAPTYSVVYRAGHGREEAASISEDVMQKFR